MISSSTYKASGMKPGSLWTLKPFHQDVSKVFPSSSGRWTWDKDKRGYALEYFDFFLFENESEADPYGTGYNDARMAIKPNCNALMYLISIKKTRSDSRSNYRLKSSEARWHKFLYADKILYGYQWQLDPWLNPFDRY